MEGIKNCIELISENWPIIVAVIGIAIGICNEVKKYAGKSQNEKIEIAKKQIQEFILKLVADAEENYSEWAKAGSIKRSEVITKIFEKYPILSKVVNQEELIEWLDEMIDNALVELREIIEQNGGMPNDLGTASSPSEN